MKKLVKKDEESRIATKEGQISILRNFDHIIINAS